MDFEKFKFFAQYLDCADVEVKFINANSNFTARLTIDVLEKIQSNSFTFGKNIINHIKEYKLQLLDLKKAYEEDVELILELLGVNNAKFEQTVSGLEYSEMWGPFKHKTVIFGDTLVYKEISKHNPLGSANSHHKNYVEALQRLQNLGYGLPYLGKSVDELIQLGWIQFIK